MAYEPPTKWSIFKLAVRRSYVSAAALTVFMGLAVLAYAATTAQRTISPAFVVASLAGFYVFALGWNVLGWYSQIARSKRDAWRNGWGE